MNSNAAQAVNDTESASQCDAAECTRDRVLGAAREVFAEFGFKGATVREICRHAGVNVAAVNYHFSSKEALFMAALSFEPINTLMSGDGSPLCAKARLTKFMQELITRLMNETGTPQSRLMVRELVEPTLALDSIVKDVLAPLHKYVGQLVREIVGDKVAEDEVRRCVFSIFGQCAFYRNAAEVIRRMYPNLKYDQSEIEATAKHIVEFSLAGLERIAALADSNK
jgi:AcrR family transcriptional regulator